MSDSSFFFFLPRLLSDDLISDDSSHYALVSYSWSIMSDAVRLIVKYIGDYQSDIPINTKKRVKFQMEFLAVALSLPIADCQLHRVAARIYQQWLLKSTFFGDLSRQNKYIRRIITQLSLPFQFRDPMKATDIFEKDFYPLLELIFDTFENLIVLRGLELETETWCTIFNTLIGINDALFEFEFGSLLPAEKMSKLKQKGFSVLFLSIQNSGLKELKLWETLSKYCGKWSVNLDFLKVWGKNINILFSYLNSQVYNISCSNSQERPLLSSGVYSKEKPIDLDTLSFIFYKTNFVIDFQKTIDNSPLLLLQLTRDISAVVETALEVSRQTSTLLLNRYPASSFLKLFGRFLTFAPKLPQQFDKAVSFNIDSILQIVAHFDHTDAEEALIKMISYVLNRTKFPNELTLASFLNRAIEIFQNHIYSLPLIASAAIVQLNHYTFPKSPEYNTLQFHQNVVSLMISSSEISGQLSEEIFNGVWNNTHYLQLRLSMLSYAHKLNFQILEKIVEVFHKNYTEYINLEEGINYLVGLLVLVGSLIRAHPDLSCVATQLQVMSVIVTSVRSNEPCGRVIIAALLMILSMIEWGKSLFQDADNITHFFKFVDWLRPFLDNSSSFSKQISEIQKSTINALFSIVTARINVHMPQNDFFTRRLNSSSEINEAAVIKFLNIEGCKIRHYTVDNYLLVSFLEKDDGKDPMAIFVRGAFGKTIWTVSDDYQGQSPEPALSEELQKTAELPAAKPTRITPITLCGEKLEGIQTIDLKQLIEQDDVLRNKYGKEFATWLDWNKYGFYTPFNEKAPYQRPRVADFLTTLGLLENHNTMKIRIQNDSEKVDSAIKKFDALDNMKVVLIPVAHVLAEDETLEFKKEHHSRMTPKLQQFMREVGDSMKVSKEAAEFAKIPKLRTVVPMIPTSTSFGAIICPSMAEDEKGAAEIAEFANKAAQIRIIFNETDFEINTSSFTKLNDVKVKSTNENENPIGQFCLIVKPTLQKLYHISQATTISDIYSPFEKEQTLSAYSFAFNLSMLMEMCESSPECPKVPILNSAKERVDIINELCRTPVVTELGPLITTQFDSKK